MRKVTERKQSYSSYLELHLQAEELGWDLSNVHHDCELRMGGTFAKVEGQLGQDSTRMRAHGVQLSVVAETLCKDALSLNGHLHTPSSEISGNVLPMHHLLAQTTA